MQVNKTEGKDVRVIMSVSTVNGFPWNIESNVDWKDGVTASEVKQKKGQQISSYF